MTAIKASIEERVRCFAAGMVAHIAKPIDSLGVTELVRQHVPATDGSNWII